MFSVCSREYTNDETVTTVLKAIVQNYESTKNIKPRIHERAKWFANQMCVCMKYISYAGYTLCTNLDKSGTNHESCIVYTQVIRVRLMPDLIRDLQFVNLQPLAVSAQTIKGHELDLH